MQALQAQHAEVSLLGSADESPAPPQPPGLGAMGERRASPAPPAFESSGTFVRGERKVGRNEPCPCGSGKKYKHCHGTLSSVE